jgi:hypothetical protein
MAVTLPKSVSRILIELTGDPRPDTALSLALKDAIAYRLEQIERGLKAFEEKYGMPFEAYRRLWEEEDRPEHYSFEAERDYLHWEALITRKERLERLAQWLP